MSGQIWIEAHNLIWGLKQLLAIYKQGRVMLVTHPNDNGEIGGGKAYIRFAHTVLELTRYTEPQLVKLITSSGEEEEATVESAIKIIKCRYGSGLGMEIATELVKTSLTMREIGVICK